MKGIEKNKPSKTKAQAAPIAKPLTEYIQNLRPYSNHACLQNGSIIVD